MNTINPDKFWQRVAKAIPMLDCAKDDEALAAVRGVGRMLAGGGVSFLDLAERVAGLPAEKPQSPYASATQANFGDLARACRDSDRGRLTARERAFVAQMCAIGFRGRPSLRQAKWLADIFAGLQGRAAA